FGGFMVQGKTIENAKHLILDAKNLQEAGVFSIVLESIPWQIAELITKEIDIPTIGIGAGPYCDGQILVLHDMLGLFTDFKPKFVKNFGNVRDSITEALEQYKNEVLDVIYPNKDYSYDYIGDQLEDLKEWVENNDLNKEAAELSKTIK
ncbi:MAG: 3-methyl-2-oxobutanoate hydroxymethyltransferase, partial [Promethearchaeota archaeon]